MVVPIPRPLFHPQAQICHPAHLQAQTPILLQSHPQIQTQIIHLHLVPPAYLRFQVQSDRDKIHLSQLQPKKKTKKGQWAKAFYANPLSFNVAEDKEFKKALEMTRPGIGKDLLSRKDLAGKHLTREDDKIDDEMNSALQGRYVVMSQDGWSNIHREPIIASCLHVPGKTFLHEAVDVGDLTKDAAYCASPQFEAAEEKYGCTVIGFVSHSESKMVKVRQIL